MPDVDRRLFLSLAGTTAAAALLNGSIARAAAIPANRTTGTLKDVEHIVVLMQENRSFDHYFGMLRGVRGFGDPHPATLPSGKSVWHQSDGTTETLPFRPQEPGDDLSLYFVEDLDHSWEGGHIALNGGNYDQWVPAKGTTTMAHLERKDLPFHYALADAFTICDANYCSLLGPTDPNRYYMWTGWVGNDGSGSGPVVANDEIGYNWTTYPERLQAAGVSWKIYQDQGDGLDGPDYWGWTGDPYIGNYGDNSLLYFTQYQNAQPGDPLYEKARTGTNIAASGGLFDELTADVKANRLPSVSWVAAPEAYTEHPAWPAGYGAWYIAGVLDALTSNPEVWSKTALIITFDENDGFFDHLVPPVPSVSGFAGKSTVALDDELYTGNGLTSHPAGPYGLGVRVPMLVVSPWSTGGWVDSEVFDHTSIIRLIENRFGVREPNITPWRRAVTGDLTSAFDFGKTNSRVPKLPDVSEYKPTGDASGWDHPAPPAEGALPKQESGLRPSRRLGYELAATVTLDGGRLRLSLKNTGRLGAHVQARSLTLSGAPFSYTVGAGHSLEDAWTVTGVYDLELQGPNGFYRRNAGSPSSPLQVTASKAGPGRLQLALSLAAGQTAAVTAKLDDAYGRVQTVQVRPGRAASVNVQTQSSGGWYDVTVTTAADADFVAQVAGRLEDAGTLTSDPQLGAGPRQTWNRPWPSTHEFHPSAPPKLPIQEPKGQRNLRSTPTH